MKILGTPVLDYLPALGLALLTAAFLATSYSYSAQARAFPAPVAWVTLALIALDLISRTQTAVGDAIRRHLNPGAHAPEGSHPLGKHFAAALWLAVFAVVLVLIGVLYAVPLYMFASLRFQGRRSWFTSLWVSAVATGALWLLFAVVLRLELYPGYFFGGA
ncbi:MAG: tripartite tricarboxylate transporter TctB family protein [Bryobacteraceae bacterium]|jgi:hypothetical protein